MVPLSQNRVSLSHILTSNTKSEKKQRKRTKLSLSSSSPELEDFDEEREDFMVFPSGKTHLLKPCFTTSIEATLPPPDLKALSLSVSFHGYRLPHIKFKSWAKKMSFLHEPTWKKAGIYEALVVSTKNIIKDSDLVLSIAEKWCPVTKTFVFPWGEAAITLEDVMVLLGFSVLGSPVFAALHGSGEQIKEKLEKEWLKIKKVQASSWVTQAAWMRRFMDGGDEYHHMDEAVFTVAVHLSSGTRIALAPAVLAHLYAELSLLKDHIELKALARWDDVKQGNNDVRQILNNYSFEWRPYTKAVKNWMFPNFYPEKAMWVPVGPDLDEEIISFARCIKVSELVGLHSVKQYFPNRVASQFGLLQDVPCPVKQSNLFKDAAWVDYNKPIDGLRLYIPSRSAVMPRVTSMFCDRWRKSFPQLQHSWKSRNIIGDAYDDTSASGSRKRTRRKRVCSMAHCQTHDSDEDLSLTIAQIRRLSITNGIDATDGGENESEPLGKKSRSEVENNDSDPHQEISSVRADGNERNEGKENNSSDPPLGLDDATHDILVSPQLETRQTCDDEAAVHGSNVEKMTMTDDGNKELDCLLHEDGGMAGEKASSEKIASNADNNETTPLASGGSEVAGEPDSGNAGVDEAQGHGCLFHDTVLGSEETMKSSEQLENVGDGDNDSFEKSLNNVKVMALSIEERIIKLQRKQEKPQNRRKLQQQLV